MPFVAPWLQPTDVLGAIRAGSGVGLQIRQQNDAEQAAAARLMQAQIEQQQQQQQAAERLRLSQQEMFNQARQQEIANQIRGDAADLDRQKFDEAQATQSRLEEANKLFGSTLATGLSGEKPDILGAFSKAASAAPGATAVQKLDADALIRAQQTDQNNGMSRGLMTYYAQLGAQTGEQILNPALPGGVDQAALGRATATMGGQGGIVQKRLQTNVERRADEFSNSIKAINPDISDKELQQHVNEFVSSNGQSAMIPQAEMKTIAAGDVLSVGLQKALEGVKAFNDKYGEGAFDQFTGPVDARIAALERKLKKPLSGSDKEAVTKILQGVNQVSQAYRLANFGTALSATEQKQFEKIIAEPDSASFLTNIEGAIDTTKGILGNKMKLYPYAQNPGMDEFRNRYRENGSAKPAVENAPPIAQRKADKTYRTPMGDLKWTGTGWLKP